MFTRMRHAMCAPGAGRTRQGFQWRSLWHHERSRRMISRRKRIVFTLIACALLGLLMLLTGEILLRARQYLKVRRMQLALAETGPAVGWAMFDRDLRYRNRPLWQDHNEWGMRDKPVEAKSNDRFRLLWLGDSIGYYGDTIEDTYPERLEAQLNAVPELMPSEILNAGTKGYTTYQELLYLKKFGPELQPDGVAVAFCVNDLYRFLHQFHLVDGKIIVDSYDFTRSAKQTDVPQLLRPSLFLAWTWRRGRSALARLRNEMLFETRLDVSPAWGDDDWPELEKTLTEMSQTATDLESPLFVVAFPHGLQYRQDYLARDRNRVLKPQRQLKTICQRLGIVLLDLYPELAAEDFEDDAIHLTLSGRKKAAEALRKLILQERLVPTRNGARPASQQRTGAKTSTDVQAESSSTD